MIFHRLDKSLDNDCELILQVHDEIVCECPISKVEYVKTKMQEASIIPLYIIEGDPLIIPIDITVGKNWKDCK